MALALTRHPSVTSHRYVHRRSLEVRESLRVPFLSIQDATAKLVNSTPLAHEIAEESAKSDIESFCVWRITDDGLLPTRWYDIATQLHDGEREWVNRAVKYLEARGILIRNQQSAMLVRWEGL